MNSKILLINFTQREADKFAGFPLEVDRGYLSDLAGNAKSLESIGDAVKCYFPLAIHEYKAICINYQNSKEIDEEFRDIAESYSKRKIDEFIDYWLLKTNPVIVFLGDYKSGAIINLGVRGLSLTKVTSRDKTARCLTEEFNNYFEKIKGKVIMPTEKYIEIEVNEDQFYVKFNHKFLIKPVYRNKAGDILGCYHNNSPHDYNCEPSLFLLPQFQEKTTVIQGLLRELSKIYKKYLPELYEPNWRESDKYFPKEVLAFDGEIDSLITETRDKIKVLEEERREVKEKYSSIPKLLTEKDDSLKQAVKDTLRNVFKLGVIDADEERDTTTAHEDVIINLPEQPILAEIKGDVKSYPSTGHIGQLWKHLKHNKEIETGALILNYDINTAPEERSLAYIGEEEQALEGVIFIDTRILHNLAIAVIDYGMKSEEAVQKLFQLGRASFDLNSYIEERER